MAGELVRNSGAVSMDWGGGLHLISVTSPRLYLWCDGTRLNVITLCRKISTTFWFSRNSETTRQHYLQLACTKFHPYRSVAVGGADKIRWCLVVTYDVECVGFYEIHSHSVNFCGHLLYRIVSKSDRTVQIESLNKTTALGYGMPCGLVRTYQCFEGPWYLRLLPWRWGCIFHRNVSAVSTKYTASPLWEPQFQN